MRIGLVHKVTQVSAGWAGMRLDHTISEWLGVSRAQSRKMIIAGATYLNKKRVRIASKPVMAGAELEVWVRQGTASDVSHAQVIISNDQVLFEDDWIIAVNKPSGIPTQPTLDDARDNLYAAVRRFIAAREKNAPYLALHHRLDRDTSGVLLMAKSDRANFGLAALFREHRLEKKYLAWVAKKTRQLGDEWVIKNRLGPVSRVGKTTRFGRVRFGGKEAETRFKVIKIEKGYALVEALPLTGRTHQIRVHLSEGREPILGDRLYAPESVRMMAPRLMLHAHSLEFEHPVTGKQIRIECPVPDDFKAH